MRMMKLALVTLAALLFLLISARPQRSPSRRGPRVPAYAPEIWKIVGDFCAIKTWHPVVADCARDQGG